MFLGLFVLLVLALTSKVYAIGGPASDPPPDLGVRDLELGDPDRGSSKDHIICISPGMSCYIK